MSDRDSFSDTFFRVSLWPMTWCSRGRPLPNTISPKTGHCGRYVAVMLNVLARYCWNEKRVVLVEECKAFGKEIESLR